jgi:hypothetical protein
MDALTAIQGKIVSTWKETDISAANTEKTTSHAAVTGKTHYISGYSIYVSDAATAAAVTAFSLKSGTTVLYNGILPVSQAIGTKFSEEFADAIPCAVSEAASIYTAAAGAGSKLRVNLHGYTL